MGEFREIGEGRDVDGSLDRNCGNGSSRRWKILVLSAWKHRELFAKRDQFDGAVRLSKGTFEMDETLSRRLQVNNTRVP